MAAAFTPRYLSSRSLARARKRGLRKDDAMARWKRNWWRALMIFGVALFLSAFAGYVETTIAQSKPQSIETQLAVHDVQIADLATQQAVMVSGMKEIRESINTINDTLSNMKGIGTGAMCLLTILNLAGIGLHLYNRKPQ